MANVNAFRRWKTLWLQVVYFVSPLAAFASLFGAFFDHAFLRALGFLFFGWGGYFALSLYTYTSKNFYTVNFNDPLSRVQAVLMEIQRSNEIPYTYLLADRIADDLKSSARAIARSISEGKNSPRVCALILIQLNCLRVISLGDHHRYRGTLSLRGKQIESAHLAAARDLLASGFYTEEEFQEVLEEFEDAVSRAG